jgi:hypothetical protein
VVEAVEALLEAAEDVEEDIQALGKVSYMHAMLSTFSCYLQKKGTMAPFKTQVLIHANADSNFCISAHFAHALHAGASMTDDSMSTSNNNNSFGGPVFGNPAFGGGTAFGGMSNRVTVRTCCVHK